MIRQLGGEHERRVILLAPTNKDAEVTTSLLGQVGLECFSCRSPDDLAKELKRGAAALLLSNNFLSAKNNRDIEAYFDNQPDWSDLGVVVLIEPGATLPSFMKSLRNVTVLERPAPLRSVLSAVESAVRARGRQYQIRAQLKEIRKARNELDVLANSIVQLAWMADLEQGAFWFNRRWHQYTGETSETMSGEGWLELVAPDVREAAQVTWENALEKGSSWEMELPLKSSEGNYRIFLAAANPIVQDEDGAMRWFCTCTDIDELVRLRSSREKLLESERAARMEAERAARLKDEFLATLSHELRTPLTAILGWTELIKLNPADMDSVNKGIEVIDRSAKIQTELIADLLDMSRIISGKMRLEFEPTLLSTAAKAAGDSVRGLLEKKGVSLECHFDQDEKPIMADPGRLQQIIWNLLSNAIKFTDEGGHVLLRVDKALSQIRLTVEDDGKGIQKEFLPFLFERFRQEDASSTRKHGGLGIGLALVKQLVELHGGQIDAVSGGEGMGSKFTIHFPMQVANREVWKGESPRSFDVPDLTGIHVLVLDDEADTRELFARLLSEYHASVKTADSVDNALKLIEAEEPDVILSDIGMPGKDGYEFIRTLRQSGCLVPAAALTAFVRTEDRSRSIRAGFQVHLSKPVEANELLTTVAALAKGK